MKRGKFVGLCILVFILFFIVGIITIIIGALSSYIVNKKDKNEEMAEIIK